MLHGGARGGRLSRAAPAAAAGMPRRGCSGRAEGALTLLPALAGAAMRGRAGRRRRRAAAGRRPARRGRRPRPSAPRAGFAFPLLVPARDPGASGATAGGVTTRSSSPARPPGRSSPRSGCCRCSACGRSPASPCSRARPGAPAPRDSPRSPALMEGAADLAGGCLGGPRAICLRQAGASPLRQRLEEASAPRAPDATGAAACRGLRGCAAAARRGSSRTCSGTSSP